MTEERRTIDVARDGQTLEGQVLRVLRPVHARSGDQIIQACLVAPGSDEDDLATLRRALRQSEMQRVRAAYLMAAAGHDLRQPLQIITMALDALAESGLASRQLEILSAAGDEISSLSAGLRDLAVASRIREPVRACVPLREVMAIAAASWRAHAAGRGLKLRIRQTDRVVKSDPRLLTTILSNLVGNAVKHTRTGGVLVGCRWSPKGVRIDVVDTGPGLPIGAFADGSEPNSPIAPTFEGLGLGLAIVQDAIERIGCSLRVQTAPGRGTRFSLLIPRRWPIQDWTEAGAD